MSNIKILGWPGWLAGRCAPFVIVTEQDGGPAYYLLVFSYESQGLDDNNSDGGIRRLITQPSGDGNEEWFAWFRS